MLVIQIPSDNNKRTVICVIQYLEYRVMYPLDEYRCTDIWSTRVAAPVVDAENAKLKLPRNGNRGYHYEVGTYGAANRHR